QLAQPYPSTFRELALTGFHGEIGLQIGTDLLLGRAVDRPLQRWDACFLPRILRESLPDVKGEDGGPLASPPLELYRRRGPPAGTEQPAREGRFLLFGIAGALLALALLGLQAGGLARVARVTWGLAGGLVGCGLAGLAAYTTLPLLRANPNL